MILPFAVLESEYIRLSVAADLALPYQLIFLVLQKLARKLGTGLNFLLTYVAEHVASNFTHSSSALGCTPSEGGRHAIGEACYA